MTYPRTLLIALALAAAALLTAPSGRAAVPLAPVGAGAAVTPGALHGLVVPVRRGRPVGARPGRPRPPVGHRPGRPRPPMARPPGRPRPPGARPPHRPPHARPPHRPRPPIGHRPIRPRPPVIVERPRYRPYAPVGAALAGAAVGTAIGAAASSGTTTVVYPDPSTAEWNRLCAEKYRSFRPSDGTYLGYDGERHVCRIP